ncbi:MAG: PD-(D/E)XK nuclease domain-containing protein, partial [Holophagales bacterium]|nr:PD-(D/E)XK nuclease domain-containing protein [Holophagales bacterium]
ARLREPRVQRVLEPILAGQLLPPEVMDDDLEFTRDLGLVRSGDRGLEIANPIYREVIPRALASVAQESIPLGRDAFVGTEGGLDFDALLEAFAGFWVEHAEHFLARQPYSEAAAQLIFMAFLQRIVNGGGFVDREYAVGAGRIDLCVRWPRPGETRGVDRWAVELKVWRADAADPLPQGLEQLGSYLERLGLRQGTLVIFDLRPGAPPLPERRASEVLEHGRHRIRVMRL